MEHINIEEGVSRLRGNQALYKRMLEMYLASDEFSALEEALDEKDYERAAGVAHAIKGMTGNLSLTLLFECSQELLAELRENRLSEDTLERYRKTVITTRNTVLDLLPTL